MRYLLCGPPHRHFHCIGVQVTENKWLQCSVQGDPVRMSRIVRHGMSV